MYTFLTDDNILDMLILMQKDDMVVGSVMPWHYSLVEPCTVLEPLKARIITKPSPGAYVYFTNCQEFLWKKLKMIREFELIGRPVEDLDIHYILKSYNPNSIHNKIISGDFSGATNKCSSEISNIILGFLFQEFSVREYERLQGTFSSSHIQYSGEIPKGLWSDFSYQSFWSPYGAISVHQKNGQLMGHVISFIVLCLANYLSFLYSCFLAKVRVPNVLINGDDILFVSPNSNHYENWCSFNISIGFIPSLGKNLSSRNFAQINSVLYRINYFELNSLRYVRSVNSVPYLNFGILTGRGKGKSSDFTNDSCNLDEVEGFNNLAGKIFPSLEQDLDAISGFWGGFWDFKYVRDMFFEYRERFFYGKKSNSGSGADALPNRRASAPKEPVSLCLADAEHWVRSKPKGFFSTIVSFKNPFYFHNSYNSFSQAEPEFSVDLSKRLKQLRDYGYDGFRLCWASGYCGSYTYRESIRFCVRS
jgi:hypothetical protein